MTSALDLIADELERFNGLADDVKEHMAAANKAQSDANTMLGKILHQLEQYSEESARTSRRLSALERRPHEHS